MVKVAIAGGTGQVAREVIDALQATGQHEILVLTRSPLLPEQMTGITAHVVHYHDRSSLTTILTGTHTLLSFIPVHIDPDGQAQRTLIDAAVAAGVKRFAPSEWAGADLTSNILHLPKSPIRTYLSSINHPTPIISYTLFQPGIFLEYLAFPHRITKHVAPLQTPFNFAERRAILVDGHDPVYTFTSVKDLAAIVARAVAWEGTWPLVGGVCGGKVRASELVALGERVRGGKFEVETVRVQDLEQGRLDVEKLPSEGHHSFEEKQMVEIIKSAYVGIMLNGTHGGWDVGREWNEIFGDYEFEGVKEFVERVWRGKP